MKGKRSFGEYGDLKIAVVIFIVLHVPTFAVAQDTIQLKKYAGNLKTIDVSINGMVYKFLFDTGGGETLISPEIATRNNKSVYGSLTAFRMHGEMISFQRADSLNLRINSMDLYHPSVGVWDVMSVLPTDWPRIDGVLSLKSFIGKKITLDLHNNRIIMETKKSYRKRISHMTRQTSRFANGLNGNEMMIFLETKNAGRSFWLLVDTGNLGNVLLSPSTVEAWGLHNAPESGSVGTLFYKLGKDSLGIESSQEKIIYDGALNYHALSNFTILIDLAEEEVWVEKRTQEQ